MHKPFVLALIAAASWAFPAHSQQAPPLWVNVPAAGDTKAPSEAGTPALVVVGEPTVDLGAVDGDRPVLGQITIENRGDKPFSVIVPSGFSATPLRVQFPSQGTVALAPGGRLVLPLEYDARLDDGAGAFSVALDTTDPAAPQLRQAFTLKASHQAVVAPHRDLLSSVEAPVRFFFTPKDGGRFVAATLEDASAPITLTATLGPEGRLEGLAALDAAKAASAPPQGAVRVVGTTEAGRTAYLWLQWVIKN